MIAALFEEAVDVEIEERGEAPDLFGVVFDPAGPRVILLKLAGGAATGVSGGIVNNRARAGSALVYCKKKWRGHRNCSFFVSAERKAMGSNLYSQ